MYEYTQDTVFMNFGNGGVREWQVTRYIHDWLCTCVPTKRQKGEFFRHTASTFSLKKGAFFHIPLHFRGYQMTKC